MPYHTLIIQRSVIGRILTMADVMQAVEQALHLYGEGRVQMPPKVYMNFAKSGIAQGDLRTMPAYVEALGFASVKNVNVHPGNRELPTVMGTLTLFDPETGFPLAVMDATLITKMRTGAAGGIAAKYLSRENSCTGGFIGAGVQAESQLEALMLALPGIENVVVFDTNPEHAGAFAEKAAARYKVAARVAATADEAVAASDILTTTTPVRSPIVKARVVRPGTHINAIGADAPGKQELESALLQSARVVIDNWEQASHSGEINVPVSQGLLRREDIYGDIGEIVCGKKRGRDDDDQITVFDSTGLAIQDLACAARVYEALKADAGRMEGVVEVDLLG